MLFIAIARPAAGELDVIDTVGHHHRDVGNIAGRGNLSEKTIAQAVLSLALLLFSPDSSLGA